MRIKVSIFLAIFAFLAVGAAFTLLPSPTDIISKSVATIAPTLTPLSLYPLPESTLIPEAPDRYNFLLLGGDYREDRMGTEYGDKTDVMLLATITMTDPAQIRVVQFPRNFYKKITALDDMWLFRVYGREGFPGLHYYFQQAFGVDLNGIAYINMDNFVAFVDDLGGLWRGTPHGGDVFDGEAVLAYLRDNENNWGCPEYDCNYRQYITLLALADKIKTRFHEDPLTTAKYFWAAYRGLFETDLSEFEQFHWLVELGWRIATSHYEIQFDKLTTSGYVEYGNAPLEVRGWIVKDGHDLYNWFK